MRHRYSELAERVLDVRNTQDDGVEVTALCPFHDDHTPSFRFNTRTGLWICYSCGEKGNIEKFLKSTGAKKPTPSLEILNARLEWTRVGLHGTPAKGPETLPDEVLDRYAPWHPAWGARGFTRSLTASWELGYDPLTDRLTIPVRDHRGRLVGVVHRRLGDEKPRYVYPKNFPKKELLYGAYSLGELQHNMELDTIHDVDPYTVALVEGPLDAVRVWQTGFPTLALFGLYISPIQVKLLHMLNTRTVIFFLDNDDKGRKATERLGKTRIGIRKKFVDWSGFKEGLDPGALRLGNIRRLIEGAR